MTDEKPTIPSVDPQADKQQRLQSAQKAVAAAMAEYRCQMVAMPGESSVTPNGTTVTAPPVMGMVALD